MKESRRYAGGLVAVALAIAFAVPMVPAKAASYSVPSTVPPLNVGILTDPTGTYQFTYLGNGTYSMNFTAYQKLLKDPYTGISAESVKIEGNTVLMTVPASNVVSGPTSSSSPTSPVFSPSGELESVTSWLSGYGTTLVNGAYRLRLG